MTYCQPPIGTVVSGQWSVVLRNSKRSPVQTLVVQKTDALNGVLFLYGFPSPDLRPDQVHCSLKTDQR